MKDDHDARPRRSRAHRADSARTEDAILVAAEQILSRNPHATVEQIAHQAGVARTTVHRRFASREALVEALTRRAFEQFAQAVEDARPDSAPPLVALYQATANALTVKSDWSFALAHATPLTSEVERLRDQVRDSSDRILRRAKDAGLMRPDVDIDWTRRVYYALICEAARDSEQDDADTRAARVVDTILNGAGSGSSPVVNKILNSGI